MTSDWAWGIANTAVHTHGALQKPRELADMLDVLRGNPPKVILEVGAEAGGTLWAWQEAFPGVDVWAIDLPAGDPATPDIKYGRGLPIETHGSTLIRANSQERLTLAVLQLKMTIRRTGPIDLLFIDADHSLEGVRTDYAIYSPLVRPGGIVMFHDICIHPDSPLAASGVGVHEFWASIQSPRKHEIIHPSLDWGGIGYLYTPEPI